MRDYDKEFQDNERKYGYDFDYDVIHPYMIRAFSPMIRPGAALELGCFQGRFTERLARIFDDITCVEGSGEAIAVARARMKDKAQFIRATFEEAHLPKMYENIFMTHVLEHIDDRVGILKKIHDEWLSDGGRFFVAVPNANAPSRRLAVKMGLMDHASDVTEAERKHGHRVTYSLETLEKDVKAAGFKVLQKSGIFFKALANFQWDRVISEEIVTREYLDACFELGQEYPDMCSSVFCVCTK